MTAETSRSGSTDVLIALQLAGAPITARALREMVGNPADDSERVGQLLWQLEQRRLVDVNRDCRPFEYQITALGVALVDDARSGQDETDDPKVSARTPAPTAPSRAKPTRAATKPPPASTPVPTPTPAPAPPTPAPTHAPSTDSAPTAPSPAPIAFSTSDLLALCDIALRGNPTLPEMQLITRGLRAVVDHPRNTP